LPARPLQSKNGLALDFSHGENANLEGTFSLQRQVSRRQWIRSIAAIAACTSLACRAASAAAPKRVILLHSFGREFRPWSEYAKGIRAELEGQSPWPLDVIEFSMTAARFSGDDTEQPFVDYLHALFANYPPDLIVSIGAPAAGFVQRHRQQLFPATPMVLTAVERRRLVYTNLTENDTVVAVAHDLPAVIDNILRVLPDTRNVDVVNGNSPLEKFWLEEMRREFKPFEGRVAFTWYNNLSFDDILKRAATLPPHSAIFWELLIVDAAGAVYDGDKALTRVHAVANAPIFSFDDSFFGKELVGGPMHSVLEGCRQTAAVAVRVLGGEKAGDIKTPPLGFAAPKFDWREMQRWGISENVLPPNSTIYFREPTALERYRPQILAVSAAVLAQAALIAWLIYEHRRRNLAEVRSRNAIAELTSMNRRAAAGQLSASIAHEVNQPLTAITAEAAAALIWLGKATPDLGQVKAALEEILGAGHRAGDIIHSLRAMFKKDSNERAPVDINSVILSVLSIVRIDLQKNDIQVQTELDDQLPAVAGDKVQLQQVTLNLVMNAIDAMQSAEHRVLRVQSQRSKPDKVTVSIEDTGTGIDPSVIDRIFSPLFTTKTQGTGMGLAICQSIIESHGGRIWASSEVHKGAIFHFELLTGTKGQ
jgi:signal transduction histidine kinase